ncbi:MAG: hypothetical protein ACE15C_20685 [Phycisphaerae bacterium]
MHRRWIFLLYSICAICGLICGCTAVTQDQKDWIRDKANRSAAFVTLMDGGQTTRAQEQDWIRGQDESWRLWSRKIDLGLAAPNWMADSRKQAAPSTDAPSRPTPNSPLPASNSRPASATQPSGGCTGGCQ